MIPVRHSAALVAATLILAALGCETSDTLAPEGASIFLNPSPAQIVLEGGIQRDDVVIVATVTNSLGVPLPGQDVRFTTDSGTLDPPALTPVETDRFGNATTTLKGATKGPQITARSGKAMAQITLNAASGILSSIILTTSDQSLDSCSEIFDPLTAIALDPSGKGVGGVTIVFEFTRAGDPAAVGGDFMPNQGVSGTDGEVTSKLDVKDSDCDMKCKGASCILEIRARSGSVTSPVVLFSDLVP
jgi:hypothetical protein